MLSIQLVADINQLERPPQYSDPPIGAVEFQGDLYFPRLDRDWGTELWKYDAGTGQAGLFLDINPGLTSSSPSGLANINGVLYFGADDGQHGRELWRSDGTVAGTQMVADALPGDLGASPSSIVPVDFGLMFTGTNGLWRSDGTAGGTTFVAQAGWRSELVSVGDRVYFTWNDYYYSGEELWTSDGTASGTGMVVDLTPDGSWVWEMGEFYFDPNNSSPRSLTAFQGQLYFLGSDDLSGLWRTDGTEAGTVLIEAGAQYNAGGYRQLEVLNDVLYYPGYAGPSGTELWRSDGTPGSGMLVADLDPGSGSSGPQQFLAFGDSLYFTATDPANGRELWKSDGTAGGTALVKSINPSTSTYLSPVGEMANAAGQLYFVGNDGTSGRELWKSDGTSGGTQRVADLWPGGSGSTPKGLTAIGSTVLFTADAPSLPRGLYRSDGTQAGTAHVIDVSRGTQDSSPGALAVFNGQVIFDADDGIHGREVWISDGTEAGTSLLKDIAPGAAGSRSTGSTPFVIVGDRVFFSAYDGVSGHELWKSDGTTAGTVRLADIRPGSSSSSPRYLTNVGGTLFFSASDGVSGWELWRSDGTTAGTVRVADIRPGSSGSSPSNLTNVGGTLFFSASDGVSGYELWKSDGTTAGTVRVADIRPGSYSSSPRYLTNVGGTLYFSANDGVVGQELWKSDGTVSGTVLVKNIAPEGGYYPYYYSSSSYPRNFFSWNGQVFFSAYHPDTGQELWKTDGTADGTVFVRDLTPWGEPWYGPANSDPRYFVELNGQLLFGISCLNGTYPHFYTTYQLWTTDGTTQGTTIVSATDGSGQTPVVLGDKIYYYSAYAWATLRPIWESDGTPAGTVPLLYGSGPVVAASSALYFAGLQDARGVELLRLDPGAPRPDAGGPYTVETGSTVVLDASATTDLNNPFASLSFEWDLDFDGVFGESGAAASRGDELGVNPTFSAAGLYSGNYMVSLRVTDPTGLSNLDTAVITVTPPSNNLPPTADAGGPYVVTAGTAVQLDATGTTDPNLPGDAFLYDWDLDDDGVFGEIGAAALQGDERGATPWFSAAGLISQTWSVALRVTDAGGLTSTDTATVQIVPPPNNQPPTAEAGGPYAIQPNGSVALASSATDPNLPTDVLVFEWDLDGDGLFGESGVDASRGDERGPSPLFLGAGITTGSVTVSLRVSDSGGLTAYDTAVISVIPPVVLGASTSSGLPIAPGASATAPVNALLVSFSREMDVVGGAAGVHSVTNVANWRLHRDGTDLTSRIGSVDYLSATDQARLNLAVPLMIGDLELQALPAMHDAWGNPLDGNGDGAAGDPFTLAFTVVPDDGAPEFRVNTFTTSDQKQPAVGMGAQGDFVVAWASNGQDGSGDGIYAQRYAASGMPIGAEFLVNTTTSGNQFRPAVAVDGSGAFVIAWDGSGPGEGAGVFARRYDANGLALADAFLVNSTTAGIQSDAAVALDADGDFVIVWSGNGTGDSLGVFARRYDRFGVAQGGEFRVNVTTSGTQNLPAIAMDPQGNFVVTWFGNGAGDADGTFYRVYDAAGVALTGELLANTSTAFATTAPAVATDGSGAFVIAWQSDNQDGNGAGIYARSFSAAGAPLAADFLVNTTTVGQQRRPAVARKPGGAFLVTWQSPDASGEGIYGQWYTASGAADGSEFPINTTVAGNQEFPALASTSGATIVVWESGGQDGSGLGVYGQRFVTAAPALPRVVGVTVGSTLATHAEYPVPVGSGEQLRTVPVGQINQFRLTFDSDVYVLASDLQVEGQQVPNYALQGFSYDAPSRTATWTLAQPIGADRITLRLSDAVTTLDGAVLDGEWDNPTSLTDPSGSISGDGTYGGEFEFYLTSLPGDANRDNVVTGADFTIWADHFDNGQGAADAVFAEGDFNGDGYVTGADYTLWADHFGLDFSASAAGRPTALAWELLGIGGPAFDPLDGDSSIRRIEARHGPLLAPALRQPLDVTTIADPIAARDGRRVRDPQIPHESTIGSRSRDVSWDELVIDRVLASPAPFIAPRPRAPRAPRGPLT